MEQFYASSQSLTRRRYFRLMALSCMDALVTLPIGILTLCLAVIPASEIIPWPGWGRVHRGIGEIVVMSSEDWRTTQLAIGISIFGNWITVFWAILFFLLFGLSDDMRRRYRAAFWKGLRAIGIKYDRSKELPEMQFEPGPIIPPKPSDTKASISFGTETSTDVSTFQVPVFEIRHELIAEESRDESEDDEKALEFKWKNQSIGAIEDNC